MATGPDPYRVLGVPRGASVAEIKGAYRALAKVHHPDAAGQASLPRFLEIQAAYEALVGGRAPRAPARPAPPRRPAQPSPGRTEGARRDGARHEGARTDSSEWARTWTGTDGSTAGASGPRRARPGGGAPGAGGAQTGPRSGAGRRYRPARPPNKATFGSTTYDDAEPMEEAAWDGASWYGASSGTYWTINPREYADPRKHGPEYQARARRARAGRAAAAAAAGPAGEPAEEMEADSPADSPPPNPPDGPSPSDASVPPPRSAPRPNYGPLPGDRPRVAASPGSAAPASPASSVSEPEEVPAGVGFTQASAPAALPRRDSMVGRLALAVLGWVPAWLAISLLAGPPASFAWTLPIHVVGVALLTRRPRAAWASAIGTLVGVWGLAALVVIATIVGATLRPDGVPPWLVVVSGLPGWLLGAALGRAGRFGEPPWEFGAGE